MAQFQKDAIFWCNYFFISAPIVSFYFCNMLTIRKKSFINNWWKMSLAFGLLTILCEPFHKSPYLHLFLVNCGIFLLLLYMFANPVRTKVL